MSCTRPPYWTEHGHLKRRSVVAFMQDLTHQQYAPGQAHAASSSSFQWHQHQVACTNRKSYTVSTLLPWKLVALATAQRTDALRHSGCHGTEH
eukprot:1161658-Pelagomonas_calceolata.AAC.5